MSIISIIKYGTEGIIIIVIGLFILVSAILVPENPVHFEGWVGIATDAGFVPALIGIVLIVIGIKMTITQVAKQNINFKASKTINGVPQSQISTQCISISNTIRLIIIIAIMIIYVPLLKTFSFLFLTFLYLAIMFIVTGFDEIRLKKNKPIYILKLLIIAIISALVIGRLLPRILGIRLP